MNDVFSWDFTLANYGAVWAFMVQIGLLLLFLMLGNILRRVIPLFRKCLIPSALLGGGMLLIVNIIGKQFDFVLVDNRLMQVITYHCLAIGFASMTLKTEKSAHKTNKAQIVEFGALQGGSYMLQAFVGLGITLVLFLLTQHGNQVISYICGLILPLAYGQGPGNALTWDINFTNTPATQFAGNGSFGLSLASIGFVVASVFGVLHINIGKKRGSIKIREARDAKEFIDLTNPCGNEIPDNESVDKFSIQMGFVALAYAMAFGFMYLLGSASGERQTLAAVENDFVLGQAGNVLQTHQIGAVAADKAITQHFFNFSNGHFNMDHVRIRHNRNGMRKGFHIQHLSYRQAKHFTTNRK